MKPSASTRPNRIEQFLYDYPALQDAIVFAAAVPVIFASIAWSVVTFWLQVLNKISTLALSKRKRRPSRSEAMRNFPQNILITGAR
jgi:hypothetical protein